MIWNRGRSICGQPRAGGGRVGPFEPHPWLRGGHLQTIAGRFLPAGNVRLASARHEVRLGDGDRIVVCDSIPPGWRAPDPAVVLVHGLAGCARSPYVVRVAARLVRRGIRAVRMNLRGAGAGFGAARRFYHSGLTGDLRAVVDWLSRCAAGSPIGLVGFSLGGNLVLKLAAEAADEPLAGLDCVLAASPPLDLAACCRHIQRPENRVYDRNFVRLLVAEVRRMHEAHPELGPIDPGLTGVTSLFDFDDRYTAPRNGFDGADDYYARCSAGPLLARVRVPGLIVQAEDDPFIPPEPFRDLARPEPLGLELWPSGGHLGFVSRCRHEGSHRWLDARLTSWLEDHWDRATDRDRRSVPLPDLATGDASREIP
jgi:predicted alpha/beta-fold hydrolase